MKQQHETKPDEETPLVQQRESGPFGVPLNALTTLLIVIVVTCISGLCFKTSLRSMLPSIEAANGPKVPLNPGYNPEVKEQIETGPSPSLRREQAAEDGSSKLPDQQPEHVASTPLKELPMMHHNVPQDDGHDHAAASSRLPQKYNDLSQRPIFTANKLRAAVAQEMEAREIERHAQEIDPLLLMSEMHAITEYLLFNDKMITADAPNSIVIPVVGIMTEKFADQHAETIISRSKVTSWSSDSWVDASKNLWRRVKICKGQPEVCKTEKTVIKKGEEDLARQLRQPRTPGFLPNLRSMVHELVQLEQQLPPKAMHAAVNNLFQKFIGCPYFPTQDASPFPAMLDNPGHTKEGQEKESNMDSEDEISDTSVFGPAFGGFQDVEKSLDQSFRGFQDVEKSMNQLFRNMSFVGQGHPHGNSRSRSIVSQRYVGRDGKVHTEESETFLGDDGMTHQKVKRCVDKNCKTTENEKASPQEATDR